jgi:uncharacterized protein with von Willebrand factor type A (vWA) domain
MEHNHLPPSHLLRNIVLFARLLRALGIEVTPPQILDFVESLGHIDISRREDFRNAGRTLLVSRPEQLLLYDRAFDLFWQARAEQELSLLSLGGRQPEADPRLEKKIGLYESAGNGLSPEQESTGSETAALQTYSAQEVLRYKDFAKLTAEELTEVKQMMQAMVWQLEQRRTRRKTQALRRYFLDMRRTLRRNLRYGGEPLTLTWRRPKRKRRPLVVICDVSGSMEQYSRILLKFVYVISHGLEKVEAFVFSTRLTRITYQLKGGDVDVALERATASTQDWGGGTRLGEALKAFNFDWGRRVLGQGAIVLIISDGLDRGDVDLLDREMRRLQLSCRRLIWLNPLLGSKGYEPLARGIQAALPYIDEFIPVHNLASLEQLGQLLERLGEHRPLRPYHRPKPNA